MPYSHAMCCRYAHKMSERNTVELRADSQLLCDEWFAAIATEIEALRAAPAHPGAPTGSPGDAAASWNQPLRAWVELPCNAACADCGAAAPRWASVTHQVLICVECAGVHRYTAPYPASAPMQLKRGVVWQEPRPPHILRARPVQRHMVSRKPRSLHIFSWQSAAQF